MASADTNGAAVVAEETGAQAGMKMHRFRFEGPGMKVVGQVMAMQESAWVWLGDEKTAGKYQLGPLSAGMTSRIDGLPVSTLLQSVGDVQDDTSAAMSQRIAKRFGIQCYVSCDVDEKAVPVLMKLLEPVLKGIFEADA